MYNEISAKRYCKDNPELIDNYHEAKYSRTLYVLHHRLELTINNEQALSMLDLQRLNMYYNRPYYELIFLPASVHLTLHNKANPRTFGRKKPE